MEKKLVALGLAMLMAGSLVAGCGGDDKKPAPKQETKQTQNVKKDDKKAEAKKDNKAATAQKKEDPDKARKEAADKHAHEVMQLPEVHKYDKISKEAYPHLKWGSTGYDYKGKKNALLDYGEVEAHFIRTLSSADEKKFKDEKGWEHKSTDKYDITVLVGGCKGNCVIEAKGVRRQIYDVATYRKPIIEEKVYQPFDTTYVRHEENGKKWVTHEKCGTK